MNSALKTIHVACGQIVCGPGDISGNLDQTKRFSIEAAEAGAKFILFAEASLTGYVFTPEFLKKYCLTADSRQVRELHAISRRDGIVIAAGAVEQAEDGRHVSHFILFPDGRKIIQRKHNLTPTEKKAGIIPGPEERILITVDGVRFGICICADSGIPDIRNKLAAKGCQVFCGPCAGGGGREHMLKESDLGNPRFRKQYIKDMEKVCFAGKTLLDCRDHRMATMAVNLAGDDGIDHYHPGHSMIIDSRGYVVDIRPGEYVIEFLVPKLLHGNIAVNKPSTVQGKQEKKNNVRKCISG